jgi:hypothetical protein
MSRKMKQSPAISESRGFCRMEFELLDSGTETE